MERYDPDNQRLFFDDLYNCRDLGGIKGSDGRVFKERILIRCASPSLASDKAFLGLKEFGVRTVIDLRSEAELSHYGNPFMNDPDVSFFNVPLYIGDPDDRSDRTMNFLRTHKMGDFYVMMLEELGGRICDIMRIILNHGEGITLFHCAHGKDRTGVITALLYMLIGVPREDIILNYRVSYDYTRILLDPLIEAKEPELRHTLRSDAENMEIMLDFMKTRYDFDAALYLEENGLSRDEISGLEKLITR